MRVITVGEREFGELCDKLLSGIRSSGYDFDTPVAVARAGIYLAEKMIGDNYFTVRCEREGTGAKKGWIKSVVGMLPLWVNDNLRKLEYRLLALKDKFSDFRPRKVIITPELEERLKDGGRRVLILDDAVDSGRSLAGVVEALQGIGGGNEIRTGVITVTRKNPVVNPEYALFRNQTLIRFPWAADRASNPVL